MSSITHPLLFLLATLFLAAGARADALSDPPDAWRQRLTAVPWMDVSGADPAAREVLAATRLDLARLLEQSPPVADRRVGDTYGRLAAQYHAHAVVSAAELCYRNAVSFSSDNFRWYYYAGELLRANGRYAEALAYFATARALDPDYQPLRLQVARAEYELGDLAQAEQALKSIEHAPGLEAAANYHLGRIALSRRNHAEAVRRFERTLALDPNALRVHYPLAQALRVLGERERAETHLGLHGKAQPSVQDPLMAELWALKSGSRAQFARAMESIHNGDYAAAVSAFQRGLDQEADNVRARVSYARALYLHGEAQAARPQLEQALAQQPEYALGSFLLGLLAEEAGDPGLAEGYYRGTLERHEGHSGAGLYLAGLLYRSGRYAEAAQHYRAADPEIPFAPVLAILAVARAGAPDAATSASLRALIAERASDPIPRYALARLLLASADPEVRDPAEAKALAEELVRLRPTPPHQALLALAHAANGDFELAELQLQQLEFVPPWIGGVDPQVFKADVAAYRRGELPESVWPAGDPLLQPPPVRAAGPMREYPAELPY